MQSSKPRSDMSPVQRDVTRRLVGASRSPIAEGKKGGNEKLWAL